MSARSLRRSRARALAQAVHEAHGEPREALLGDREEARSGEIRDRDGEEARGRALEEPAELGLERRIARERPESAPHVAEPEREEEDEAHHARVDERLQE